MSLTNNERKVHEQPNDTKAIVHPHTYEMKHYQHDGILQQLAFMLIRPPRFIYNPDILRPSKRASGRFTVQTLMVPFEVIFYKQKVMNYVILYMHGNGSSSFEGTLFLSYLPEGVGLACFDFKGCGNRPEGDFITLGQDESKDVDTVAIYLKSAGYRVVGWGRSMGAVSLLMSEECEIMVADSAYSNLSVLCKESSSQFLPRACCCLFHCLFPCVFSCIKCKVESLAGLDIERMDVTARLKELPAFKQICLIHGQSDTLVPFHHADQLYASFTGRKLLITFQGTHNSTRPKDVLQKCFQFIEEGLKHSSRQSAITNPKLVEMANIPSPIRISQAKNYDNKTQVIHHPQNHRPILQPIPKKNIEDYAALQSEHPNNTSRISKRPVQEEYCEIGMEGRVNINETLAINETFPEEEPIDNLDKASQEQARRPKQPDIFNSKQRP